MYRGIDKLYVTGTVDFSKTQIKEFSVLFIMLNYMNITLQKVSDISQIKFLSENNENLKKLIISLSYMHLKNCN